MNEEIFKKGLITLLLHDSSTTRYFSARTALGLNYAIMNIHPTMQQTVRFLCVYGVEISALQFSTDHV